MSEDPGARAHPAAASRAQTAAHGQAAPLPLAGFALLAGITFFWGINWPIMKIALTAVPVWDFRLLCLVTGGGGILAISRASGRSLRVPRHEIGPLALCALFNIVGWHVFTGYGLTLMESGRSAIIAYTMPLWATLFSAALVRERLNALKLVGLGLGLSGLAVLLGDGLTGLRAAPMGAVFVLLAAISWGFGTALLKRFSWSIPTASLAGWQLLAGIPVLLVGRAVFGGEAAWTETWRWQQAAALAYALTIPMVFCFWAWFQTVRLFPASIAAIGTLAIPVVGVFAGAALLDESIGWTEVVSLALVLGGLAAVLLLPALRRG